VAKEIVIPLNGHVHVKAWEKQPDGSEKVVKDDTIKNLVVTVGKDAILKYIGNVITSNGYAGSIGVGDSTTAAASGQTDLQASSNKLFKTILTANRVFITPTLFLSVEFGYTEANWTWNELGIKDNQGTPVLWARQIDASPLAKTSSKRAIVEWQLSL
jgi:hypothetical protein